ncbi:MAG TPA: Hsp20/alpha crystallin family protein [Anaerolineales bacterium]|nr:Hsp20/alpha crystallin family protein [Anaerolineae bacterium]HIQ01295.1 Hsp20/alpha crystallin family protein [Anaerolineales bacterium]
MSNLIRWEPFRDLISLREAMDRLFEESFVRPRGGWIRAGEMETLAVDMYETEDSIVVKATVPGVTPEDLDISLTGDTLTIRGEVKREEEVKEENYLRRERYYGSFCRSLPLPTQVVADDAEAVFENGVLTLTLPKAEEVRPRAIKVKARK